MQRVTVFQQNGSGERKISAVRQYGGDIIVLKVVSIDGDLPEIIDDSRVYLPDRIDADLVLDFLVHRDLSLDLAELCASRNIPVIASGKKILSKWVITPPT
jgi:hypothetical protein